MFTEWYFTLLLLTSDGSITKHEKAFQSEDACVRAMIKVSDQPIKVGEGRILSRCRTRSTV